MPAATHADSLSLSPRVRFGLAVLLVAVFAAYANTLTAPFVYDDILSIPGNPSIRRLWPIADVLFPRVEGGVTVSGRPILNLSFALNYAISGTNPWSYHLTNLAIHAASALLLFGLVRRTLARIPTLAGSAPSLALATAALWSLHPLQTQAVAYTVQRAESLMGFLYLLTFYAFLRAATATASHPRWAALCIGACALGMATKEVMVTAPVLVLLFDRTFLAGSFRAALRARWPLHLALAATWLVLAGAMLSTGGNRGGTIGFGTGVPLWAYPLTQFKAIATYLGLGAWPNPLIFEYGTLWAKHAADVVPFALLVLPLVAATVVALVRWPAAGFLGAWFFAILAPTSLAPGTIQMIVEHRIYLPLAACACGVVLAFRRFAGPRTPALCATVAAAFALLTALRNHDYRSNLALWHDTVVKRPLNPRAHEGLAEALAAAGRVDEAIKVREESVRLLPDESRFVFNLALAQAQAGRTEHALATYREVLRLAPGEARAHNNLAVLLAQLGRIEEAWAHYAEAIRIQPEEASYRYNYGLALARAGRTELAADQFGAAVQAQPDNLDYRLTHAATLMRLRRLEAAIAAFETVVQRAPEHVAARIQLADALLDADRPLAAIPHYQAAAKRAPTRAEIYHNLGVASAQLERFDDARAAFDEALRLKPDYPGARRSREQLRQLTGK